VEKDRFLKGRIPGRRLYGGSQGGNEEGREMGYH